MGEHTKGPWEVGQFSGMRGMGFLPILNSDGAFIAKVLTTRMNNGKSNAQLIAAAPELLEACRWMCQVIETINQEYWDGVSLSTILAMANSTTKAEQAIAKAEGEGEEDE